MRQLPVVLCTQKRNFDWIRQKHKHFPLTPIVKTFNSIFQFRKSQYPCRVTYKHMPIYFWWIRGLINFEIRVLKTFPWIRINKSCLRTIKLAYWGFLVSGPSLNNYNMTMNRSEFNFNSIAQTVSEIRPCTPRFDQDSKRGIIQLKFNSEL